LNINRNGSSVGVTTDEVFCCFSNSSGIYPDEFNTLARVVVQLELLLTGEGVDHGVDEAFALATIPRLVAVRVGLLAHVDPAAPGLRLLATSTLLLVRVAVLLPVTCTLIAVRHRNLPLLVLESTV